MPWECGDCSKVEDRKNPINEICHHCGKPLCKDDRVVVAHDDAFRGGAGSQDRSAVHCRECWRLHHPGLFSLNGSARA
jgi:hypothetical protein